MADIMIYGRLYNNTTDGVIASAEQIKDDTYKGGMFQDKINAEVLSALTDINSKIEDVSGSVIDESGKIDYDKLPTGNTSASTETVYPGDEGGKNRDAIESLPSHIVSNVSGVTQNADNVVLGVSGTTKNGLNYGAVATENVTIAAATTGQAGVMTAQDKINIQELQTNMYKAHASVSLSRNPNIFEKGVETSVTVTNSITFIGEKYTPRSVSIKQGEQEISTTPNSSVTVTGISDSVTFKIDVTYAEGVTGSTSVSVNAYYPMYFGGSAKSTLASADVLGMAKQAIKSSASGSYSVNVGQGEYMWLCVPNNFNVVSVTSSGFGVPMESPATVAVDDKGDYKCYRSSSTYNAGAVSIVIP